MNELTIEKIEELEKLEREATPGEWEVRLGSGNHMCTMLVGNAQTKEDPQRKECSVADFFPDWFAKEGDGRESHGPDMNFVAALRNAAPALLAAAKCWLIAVKMLR